MSCTMYNALRGQLISLGMRLIGLLPNSPDPWPRRRASPVCEPAYTCWSQPPQYVLQPFHNFWDKSVSDPSHVATPPCLPNTPQSRANSASI